jgi:hypothetical protein
MVLLGAGAAALAAPYDMPGLGDGSTAAPAQGWPGAPADAGQAGDGNQCDEGFFARLMNPCDGPRWTFTGEALALQRTGNRYQPLLMSFDDSSVVLSANNLDVPMSLGIQTSAVRQGVFGSEFDVEVGYFQTDWALNEAVAATGVGLVTDVNGANFDVDNPAIRYTAGLHLGEVNLRHEWLDGVTLLAGFGMGELDEHYHVAGGGFFVPGTTVTLDTQTFNHLYGFHVGADVDIFEENGPLHLHLLTKTGVYGNFASQRNEQTDSSDGLDQTLSAAKNQTALISQCGLALSYEVNCHVTFRMTGNAVWLACVALAPDQLGATDFPPPPAPGTGTVDTHGQIFYYGGGLGVEVRF